ncbi:MAG: hypothetical protein J2P28_03365 [Actinobacteria bacterium]|nr:hypothetical protein [Actinomycetota bacterium]MBO0834544.1 hypothetical protein [Actinomycetota bacterium]
MDLNEWAKRQSVAYATAQRWLAAGNLPVPARKACGLILAGDRAGRHDGGAWLVAMVGAITGERV